MKSPPQFSLRSLLLVMVLVCLAAATGRSPAPGGLGTFTYRASQIQAYVRLAECLLFPAIFTAWALAKGGWGRMFCIGAIVPVTMPSLIVCLYCSSLFHNLFGEDRSSLVEELGFASYVATDRISVLWVCALLAGAGCVLLRWFVRPDRATGREARQDILTRLAIVAWLAACAAAAIVWLPDSSNTSADSFFRQAPIRLVLCLTFPTLLAAGAVEGEGKLRAFCACALVPALAPVVLVLAGDALVGNFAGRWEPALLFEWRYFIVAMWALALPFGLACALLHWLFERGNAAD